MIPVLDISWQWLGKPQTFREHVEFAVGVPAGQRKMPCQGAASSQSMSKGEKAAGSTAICVKLSPETQARSSLRSNSLLG